MTTPVITAIAEQQRSKALSILTIGFSADPVMRWMFPDPQTFLQVFSRFADAFGGAAIEHGTAYIANDHQGAALWLPPGVQSDEDTMGQLFAEHAPANILESAAGFTEQMESYHPADDNCWYLPCIAVDCAYQGQGLGAALMKHALRNIDERGDSAYLESSNPLNISLYERHGFEVIGSIQSGNSPQMYPMMRPARS